MQGMYTLEVFLFTIMRRLAAGRLRQGELQTQAQALRIFNPV
jgi:hypothetical protein